MYAHICTLLINYVHMYVFRYGILKSVDWNSTQNAHLVFVRWRLQILVDILVAIFRYNRIFRKKSHGLVHILVQIHHAQNNLFKTIVLLNEIHINLHVENIAEFLPISRVRRDHYRVFRTVKIFNRHFFYRGQAFFETGKNE